MLHQILFLSSPPPLSPSREVVRRPVVVIDCAETVVIGDDEVIGDLIVGFRHCQGTRGNVVEGIRVPIPVF